MSGTLMCGTARWLSPPNTNLKNTPIPLTFMFCPIREPKVNSDVSKSRVARLCCAVDSVSFEGGSPDVISGFELCTVNLFPAMRPCRSVKGRLSPLFSLLNGQESVGIMVVAVDCVDFVANLDPNDG